MRNIVALETTGGARNEEKRATGTFHIVTDRVSSTSRLNKWNGLILFTAEVCTVKNVKEFEWFTQFIKQKCSMNITRS